MNEGEPLFALETDKVSTDIVAEKSGVLETKVSEGQEVKIGEVVAVIDDSKPTSKQDKEEKPKKKEPEAKKKEPESQKKPEAVAASVDGGKSQSATQASTLSPGVRRIVEEEKLELEKITGTGQGGRSDTPTPGFSCASAPCLSRCRARLRIVRCAHAMP